ncbi:hypothetical protein E1211_31645 [Micromonospora sp. 15K316]|uniref:hypothetical protein n=1 Tax=Micromonospora sp. 15K316 TaxID=2530376 RepID=UPI001049A5CC|nr:hypothetical protein [Micromonospora sp. 15K316]TDC22110.1 hypothetical protein E1211_31645 [Micromonospora sp. 15K316]
MSIVEDVGAQVRAAAEELPLGLVTQALEKFGLASERLRWVRQESANPMGVPELSAATEHVETAGYALRLAQEQLAAYLAAIGLGADGAAPARPADSERPRHDAPRDAAPVAVPPEPAEQVRLRRWWSVRVAELTGGAEGADEPDERITDSAELLRRVVRGVRAGDRDRLRTELRRAHADVGLGMAALAPQLLRELATELLGHPPRSDDLNRLRGSLDGRVRDLLPGLPPPVLETLLTRVCRMPPPRRSGEAPHAADSAVAGGVLTGVLLARLGRDLPADTATGAAGRPATGTAVRAGDAGRVGADRGGRSTPGRSVPGELTGAGANRAGSGGLPDRSAAGPGTRPGRPGPWVDAPRRRGSDG